MASLWALSSAYTLSSSSSLSLLSLSVFGDDGEHDVARGKGLGCAEKNVVKGL